MTTIEITTTATAPYALPRAATPAPAVVIAADTWGPAAPLTCAQATVAPRHESALIPNRAVRVRTDVVAVTGGFSATGAGIGSDAGMKQGSPPRGIPR